MENQREPSSTPGVSDHGGNGQTHPTVDLNTRAKMVGWYDPGQLVQTAQQVLISTIFGRHSDHRLMESLVAGSDTIYDYTFYYKEDRQGQDIVDEKRPRQEIWIDYVADTGDGWNSTYTVASCVSQPQLTLNDPDGNQHQTKQGDLLVFGGDEVYPTPSRKLYNERLIQPYETALRCTPPPHPHVFAIPGNHDWYDSLVSFTRLFISKHWFAGWWAPQSRSYFALKLPHGWWLLSTDVQLGSDIDEPQVGYFRKVAEQMRLQETQEKTRVRIILCNAEPHWIYAKTYGKYDSAVYNENNFAFLEDKVLGRKVTVFLAGDLHHYRRHEVKEKDGTTREKITAGGGGAFLHPTHGSDVSMLNGGYTLQSSFPDVTTSKKLCRYNLIFPFLNPKFGLLTGLLYMLTSWAVMADIGHYGMSQTGTAMNRAFHDTLISPVAVFWVLALFGGFWLFTDTHSKWYRRIAGFLHGFAHVIATFFIGWSATYLGVSVLVSWKFHLLGHPYTWSFDFKHSPQLILAGALIFIGGWIIGSFIMGVYLWVSLNIFGRHTNEAFSSLAIPDWKNFLRLRIDTSGNLTIYPIGIRRVARNWKARPAGETGPELVPDDPQATPPELIEPPIIL